MEKFTLVCISFLFHAFQYQGMHAQDSEGTGELAEIAAFEEVQTEKLVSFYRQNIMTTKFES